MRGQARDEQRWSARCWVVLALGSALLWPSGLSLAGGRPVEREGGAVVGGHGIVLAVTLPPGPYFLGELLVVTVTLRNLSPQTVFLTGQPGPGPCFPAASVSLSGGHAPVFTLPPFPASSCPRQPAWTPVGTLHTPMLAPGRAIAIPLPRALTASGPVTVTAEAALMAPMVQQGQRGLGWWDPFAGRVPAVALRVSPTVPPHRRLTLIRRGSTVAVRVPSATRVHLVPLYVIYVATCQAIQAPGEAATGSGGWEPWPESVVDEPACPGTREQWTLAAGAPGYAITVATYRDRSAARGSGR